MALRTITNAVFYNGILVSATWSPTEPRLVQTARSSSKTRYQVYPTIVDDIEGTGEFVDVVSSNTYERVGLTYGAANTLQDAIESVQLSEPDNKTTSGTVRLENKIIGSYAHEYTVEVRTTKMVSWTEGPPEEAEA